MKSRPLNTDESIRDILEMVTFLRDNAMTKAEGVTKKELNDGLGKLRSEMEDGFTQLRGEMEDGFANVRQELREMNKDLEEIKNQLDRLERRTRDDADASVKDILDLRHRVEYLEERLKKLQPA